MTEIKRITTRDDLIALANQLGVRPDWHEPDEEEVTATVSGNNFDNAGLWGSRLDAKWLRKYGDVAELCVTVSQHGKPVAEVNLATLFAWATGFTG